MNYTDSGDNKVYKVVLTGGPCGGKTTGQARVSIFFENLGWKVYRVPETAGILLSGGVKFSELDKEQVFSFQNNLIKTMMAIEQSFFDLARSCDRNCLVICDRGVMDATAYITPSQWEQIKTINGWNEVDIRDNRYNQVIHLVSAAVGAEAFYTIEDSQVRTEGIEMAKALDSLTSQAWVGHPYFDVIDNENSENFDNKLNRMLQAICTRLGIDAADRLAPASKKRKFLVKSLPPNDVFPQYQDFTVVHDYLVTPSRKMQARLRKRGQKDNWTYTHTIRRPEINKESVELKMVHSARDYMALLAQVDKTHFTIYKTRRCFLWENQYFQMDIYKEPCHSRCKNLVLLETYTSVHDKPIKLPPFLDVIMEVTGNMMYSMYNLSRKDDWQKQKLSEEFLRAHDDDDEDE